MRVRPVLLCDTEPALSGLAASNFTMAAPPPALVEWVAAQGGHCVWPMEKKPGHELEDLDELEARAGDVHKSLRPVVPDPADYDSWINVVSDPVLWFVHHKLWDASNAPDIRSQEHDSIDRHLQLVRQLAEAAVEHAEGPRPIYIYGHRLLMAAAFIRRARPEGKIHLIAPIAWGDPGDYVVLPERFRMELFDALTEADTLTFPTPADVRRFLRCCADIYELKIDLHEGWVARGENVTLVRALVPPATLGAPRERAETAAVRSLEEEMIVTRRQHVMLTVSPIDLAANLLRALTSFDTLLTTSPRFRHLITYRLVLWLKGPDIPEYAEYQERIEALAAVVNHRHGATDWMPIDLRIHYDTDQILADLRQFDLLVVPALKEGANAVPEVAAALNRRNGLLAISTGAAASTRLGTAVLTFNPFDIQEISETMKAGLELGGEERAHRAAELRLSTDQTSPEDWLRVQTAS